MPWLIAFAALCAIVAIISFLLFGRARMREQDRLERQWLRVHAVSMTLLLLAGILYMFLMVEAGG